MPPDAAPEPLGEPSGLRWGAAGTSRRVPLVLLHGFGGSSASWLPLVAHLSGRPVVAPDLPGHAGAAPPAPGASFEEAADMVFTGLAASGISRAVLCGYSLGGRVALSLALRHPERFAGLVLIGAHPGLGTAGERTERRAADERWARLIEHDGLDAFATRWAALPLFASQRDLPPDVLAPQAAIRRGHEPRALAAAMRAFSLAGMPDQRAALTRFPLPALLLAGQRDARFTALARTMASAMLDARFVAIAGAGHNTVLERPKETGALIDAFWKEIA